MSNERCTEPSLSELFGDSVMRLLMRRDGVTESDVRTLPCKVKDARAGVRRDQEQARRCQTRSARARSKIDGRAQPGNEVIESQQDSPRVHMIAELKLHPTMPGELLHRPNGVLELVAINNNDGAISITALAKIMGMDRSTLTRNLRPLEKEGLVTVGLEGWRRSRSLEITKKGRSRLREALPYWERAQETLRRNLGDQNWGSVRDSLDRLIRAA